MEFYRKEIYGDHESVSLEPDQPGFLEGILRRLLSAVGAECRRAEGHSGSCVSCGKVIYGRIPMMVTANCVQKTTDRCQPQENPKALDLIDRYHKRFPVQRNCTHCFNVIYNSVPLSLHKELCKWSGLVTGRLDFTTENETETLEVLEYFAGTRKELPYGEYTTGHENVE